MGAAHLHLSLLHPARDKVVADWKQPYVLVRFFLHSTRGLDAQFQHGAVVIAVLYRVRKWCYGMERQGASSLPWTGILGGRTRLIKDRSSPAGSLQLLHAHSGVLDS